MISKIRKYESSDFVPFFFFFKVVFWRKTACLSPLSLLNCLFIIAQKEFFLSSGYKSLSDV